MFIAALFISAETWMQPRCLLVGEWINKRGSIQAMEWYSGQKEMNSQATKRYPGGLNANSRVKAPI